MKDMEFALIFLFCIAYWKYGDWLVGSFSDPYKMTLAVALIVFGLVLFVVAAHYVEKALNEIRKWRNGTRTLSERPRIQFPFYDFPLDTVMADFNCDAANRECTFLGLNAERNNKEVVKVADEDRCKGLHVLGISGSGKSTFFESLIVQDAIKNRPIIIIDAKGEMSFINRIHALLASVGRGDDLLIFSLSHPNLSCSYNPFFAGECDPQIIIDSFFDNYLDDNTFFRESARVIFTHSYHILHSLSRYFTPLDVYTYMTNDECREEINSKIQDGNSQGTMHLQLMNQIIRDLTDQYRGWKHVITGFNNFLMDFSMDLLNQADSDIILEDCVRQRKIVYFQLPTNAYPNQAVNIARLVQSNIRYISSLIQLGKIPKDTLISVNVDEYASLADKRYKYLFSMGRSSWIMTTIAHQSLSDLEEISETFKKGVDHNTLNKIYLKQRDAELCDAIAKDIGTYMTNLPTTRMGAGLFGVQKSIGEVSYRPTNEFHFPPDRIRKLHPYGQGYYINSANDSYTCINLGRFNEIEPLPYTKRTKLDKKSGMGLFEKYYRRSAKPSSRKKRKTTIGQVEFDD